ncbi:cellulase family glycosylhydrolase [Nocardioides marmoraquaticus]
MPSPRVVTSGAPAAPRPLVAALVALLLAPLLAVGLASPAGAAAPTSPVASARVVGAPRVLTPAQCRRTFVRLVRERACIRRYRAAQAKAQTAPVTTPSRLGVGVAFGNTLPWMSASRRAAALDDVVALGARWVRMDLSWSGLQPAGPDSWSWAPYDAAIADARARGLEVLLILDYTPRWAQEPTCTAGEFCPPADPAAYGRYAGAVAARYAPHGVTSFEIWNEPNLPFFWTDPDPRDYREVLLAGTRSILAAAPQAKVWFGGLAYQPTRGGLHSPSDFLLEACRDGGCESLAGVAYHPYTFPHLPSTRTSWLTPWEHVFRDGSDSRALVSVLDSLGLGHLEVSFNESGAPTGGPGLAADSASAWVPGVTTHVTERHQAAIVADGVRTAAAQPRVSHLFVYTDRDQGVRADPSTWFGLRRPDGTKKPSYAAFAKAVSALRR